MIHFRLQTTQDFIKERVDKEAYLETPEQVRPILKLSPRKRDNWGPVAMAAFVGQLIKNNLP